MLGMLYIMCGVAITIIKWLLPICAFCACVKLIMHKTMKIVTFACDWFIYPLLKDVKDLRDAINRQKNQNHIN